MGSINQVLEILFGTVKRVDSGIVIHIIGMVGR